MRSHHRHISSSHMSGMCASVCSIVHIQRLSPSPPCCVWVRCVLSSSPPTASHDLMISSSLLRCSFRSSRGFQTACSGAPRPPWLGDGWGFGKPRGQNCLRCRPRNDRSCSTTPKRQSVVRRPLRFWRRRRAHHGCGIPVPCVRTLQIKGNMASALRRHRASTTGRPQACRRHPWAPSATRCSSPGTRTSGTP